MALAGDSGTKQMQVLMRTGFVPERRGGEGQFCSFLPRAQPPAKCMWDMKGPQESPLPSYRGENWSSGRCEEVTQKLGPKQAQRSGPQRPSLGGERVGKQAEQGPDYGQSGVFLCK